MTPIIIILSRSIPSKQGRINSGTDLGTGYGGTVCGFHTRPSGHDFRTKYYKGAYSTAIVKFRFVSGLGDNLSR